MAYYASPRNVGERMQTAVLVGKFSARCRLAVITFTNTDDKPTLKRLGTVYTCIGSGTEKERNARWPRTALTLDKKTEHRRWTDTSDETVALYVYRHGQHIKSGDNDIRCKRQQQHRSTDFALLSRLFCYFAIYRVQNSQPPVRTVVQSFSFML